MVGFQSKVYERLPLIPHGRVATYAALALAVGSRRAGRAVGNALGRNSDLVRTPCHRVVRSDGRVGGYVKGQRRKIELLKKEGVEVKKGRVDLKKYEYKIPNCK